MSKNAGQGNNQSAAAPLDIPTLASATAQGGPIVQEGEDATVLRRDPIDPLFSSAMGSAERQQPSSDDVSMRAQQQDFGGGQSLADLQKQVDSQQASARNRPVQFRQTNDFDANDAAGPLEMELPTLGDVDRMRRPDQRIEPVNDLLRWQDKAAELAFLEELVIIRIAETAEQGAEDPVPLGVNGRMIYVPRGDDMIVRRKYVAQLFNARVETVRTKIVRGSDDEPKNMIVKSNGFKYPFQIVRDDNPKGRAWARQMQNQRR